MSRLVKKTRSGETGLYIQERFLDNIDPDTGEQIRVQQYLVYWPTQDLLRWQNTKYLVELEETDDD